MLAKSNRQIALDHVWAIRKIARRSGSISAAYAQGADTLDAEPLSMKPQPGQGTGRMQSDGAAKVTLLPYIQDERMTSEILVQVYGVKYLG